MDKLYKKQIRAVAMEGSWQGFNPSFTALSDWVDEDKKDELIKHWTSEAMFEVTHDQMRYLDFQERFIEA